MGTPSLLDWIMNLLRDEPAREAFQANPQAAMASAGLSAACGDDVKDAKPFLLDHQDVAVKGVHKALDDDEDDAIEHIKHIVNNYSYKTTNNYDIDKTINNNYEIADEDNFTPLGDPGDGGIEIADSTVTDSLNHTDSSDNDGNATSGGVVVDQHGSTVGEDQAGRDANDDSNAALVFGNDNNGRDDNSVEVDGDGNAGRDINNTTTLGEDAVAAGGDVGEAEGGLIGLNDTVDAGEIHVLSDLVNVDDSLNGSLNENLDGSLNQLSVLTDGLF